MLLGMKSEKGTTMTHVLLLLAFVLAAPAIANAQAVLNPQNGHYYQVVPSASAGALSWSAANTAAQAQTFNNVNGYLVTITSAAEQAFIINLLIPYRRGGAAPTDTFWIGGLRGGTGFRWVTNEAFAYANWAFGEPNNAQGSIETVIEMYNFVVPTQSGITYPIGSWNDQVSTRANPQGFPFGSGYIVEYERPLLRLTLLDPVPALLDGPTVTTDPALLLDQGREVTGIAADGVARLVIRITDASPNERLELKIDADGGLSDIGGSIPLQTLEVQADADGHAFALYQAPLDFAQPAGLYDTAASRTVNLTLTSLDNPSTTATSEITILRPPVALVHGHWDGPAGWQNFSPLIKDVRFYVRKIDYDFPIQITSSIPPYTAKQLSKARTSALGFEFNWLRVLSQIQSIVRDFKDFRNPAGIAVAAVQADAVAHSMGGAMVRYTRLMPAFLSDDNFRAGPIHKLITIGTPHRGTPLASQLLDSANSCVRDLFAKEKKLSFASVQIGSQWFNGAVFDLQPLSSAIASLDRGGAPPLRTALVAGDMTPHQLDGIRCFFCIAEIIRQKCGGSRHPDPIARNFTVQNYHKLIGPNSDAIVPLSSALKGFSQSAPFTKIEPSIHSRGVLTLGFRAPTLVDGVLNLPPSQLPMHVINLLNVSILTFVELP